ncbi:LacI family DNA-binding transcriptional regulator [Clostridium sp. MCC353]|uniref:LacI family DNA-binding transcriptional regulator n=1 Tax=Clostridium sp. MCC353 TaxID=2592646 RepID=UPI001C00DDDD|nr:LacI family DNA-binding transcriptional regulator [Clostridium sp. MCC353]MBT9775531.1 LacI family DNA-binding transcriptional regulator [Clostridium sp. MCC353]
MGVTLKDIAKAAGVSEGTASLAINHRPGVNEETRKKVEALAREMGYYPSVNARSLAGQSSRLIGVLMPNIINVFYSSLVQEIEAALKAAGYKMILATTGDNREYEKEMIEQFISFRVECAVIYPMIRNNPNPEYLKLLDKNRIPYFFIGTRYRDVEAASVNSDIYSAICEAAAYLADRGARRFAYFGGPKDIVSNELKIRGLRDTLEKYGAAFGPEHYYEMELSTYQSCYKRCREVMEQGYEFDAAMAGDAYSMFGVYQALKEAGKEVPEDVSLICFDNILPPEVCILPLSCIEQNIPKLVEEILKMIEKKKNDPDSLEQVLVGTKLIIRDSTKN